MDAQQIVDAIEWLACALLHDSARAHAADSLQGFERSSARAIQLDRKAEESPSGSTDLPPTNLRGLATNGHRMLLDGTDEMGWLLDRSAAIDAWEAAHPARVDTRPIEAT